MAYRLRHLLAGEVCQMVSNVALGVRIRAYLSRRGAFNERGDCCDIVCSHNRPKCLFRVLFTLHGRTRGGLIEERACCAEVPSGVITDY